MDSLTEISGENHEVTHNEEKKGLNGQGGAGQT